MIPTKICGITNVSDAQAAVSHGASAIGFIFYEKSPRAISIDEAKLISDSISGTVSRVGVFVNHKKEFIDRAMGEVPLDGIQLHGDEAPEFCSLFNIPVYKALRIKNEESLLAMETYDVDGFLLDTFSPNQYGGTGKTFDWSLVKSERKGTPLILSGGLNPQNILEAISLLNPFAVDINSGVESSPGIKDHQKIKTLFHNLKKTKNTGFQFEVNLAKV